MAELVVDGVAVADGLEIDHRLEHLLTIFSAPLGRRFGTCSCGHWYSGIDHYTSDHLAGLHRGHLQAERVVDRERPTGTAP